MGLTYRSDLIKLVQQITNITIPPLEISVCVHNRAQFINKGAWEPLTKSGDFEAKRQNAQMSTMTNRKPYQPLQTDSDVTHLSDGTFIRMKAYVWYRTNYRHAIRRDSQKL